MNHKTKKIGKFMSFIVVALILIYFLEGWGWIGVLIFILTIAGLRAWKLRANLKLGMKQVEMMIWGKPLDKELWDKKEMRNTKVKIVWGKDKKWNWFDYSSILFYPSLLVGFLGLAFNKLYMMVTGGTMLVVVITGKLIRWGEKE